MEEVERRVKEEVEKRVSAAMDSEAVQQSLQQRLVAERKVLEEQACVIALAVASRLDNERSVPGVKSPVQGHKQRLGGCPGLFRIAPEGGQCNGPNLHALSPHGLATCKCHGSM